MKGYKEIISDTFAWYVGFSIWNVAFIASGYINALYNACKRNTKFIFDR